MMNGEISRVICLNFLENLRRDILDLLTANSNHGICMADRISKEQHSNNMSKIRGSETSLEIAVRKYLFREGFRYRKNVKKLPGKPDIVLSVQLCSILNMRYLLSNGVCTLGQLDPISSQASLFFFCLPGPARASSPLCS